MRKALLADDDVEICALMKATLETGGIEPDYALNGKDAQAKLLSSETSYGSQSRKKTVRTS